MTEDELEQIIGSVAMREYQAAPDWDQVKIREWAAGLRDMTDNAFVAECASRILHSALVLRFKGNWNGDHAFASACYEEAKRRHAAAGHDEKCTGDDLYSKGHRRAVISQGHAPKPPSPCTCDSEEDR